MEIRHLHGFVNMQFPQFSVFVASLVIIQTVCHIRTLLDLTDQYTWSNGMNRSIFNKITVSLFHWNLIQDLRQCTILDPAAHLCLICVSGKSTIQIRLWFTIHHIPQFIFPIFVFLLQCIIIPRMHLNRKTFSGINKLDQKRKSLIRITFPA